MAPLREEFEKTGTRLFRWRSLLPLLTVFLFLEAFRSFKYPYGSHRLDEIWEIICLIISFSGLSVRFFISGTVPKGTSGRNTKRIKADFLNTTGMYSIVRHPLYLGNFVIWVGLSLFFRLWWFTLIVILILLLYYERIIYAEEEFLMKKFRRKFLGWANETPAFIPNFKKWKTSTFPFSFRTAIKKEYHTFIAIIASFTFIEILSEFFISGKIIFDQMWVIIFFSGTLTYLIIRIIHKKSEILKVQGR